MAVCVESAIVFILCVRAYDMESPVPVEITAFLLLLSLCCFALVLEGEKAAVLLAIAAAGLCMCFPRICVFIPLYCYVLFLRRRYRTALIFLLPMLRALFLSQMSGGISCRISVSEWRYLGFLTAVSWYVAHQNRERTELLTRLHEVRDAGVEKERLLKQSSARLIRNQNDQIYIATLKERNRIAREIHDNVGHMLSRALLLSGALLTICKEEALLPHIRTLKDTLDEAMQAIRSSVHDLHDESVDLASSLRQLTEEFTFCPVRLQCDVGKQVPKEVKYCFLSITKEALHNVVRHSNATKVEVTVREHPGLYQLMVEDNGSAFSEGSDGIGIANMRERVAALKGRILITRDSGFRIFISIPRSTERHI